MEQTFVLKEIGKVSHAEGFRIEVAKAFRPALTGLGEFSHVMVLWVFNKLPWDGKTLVMPPPYKKLDHDIGLFATRSPFRPTPVGVSTARIIAVDVAAGTIEVDWIDADHGSPVIDLKPYHPSEDCVRDIALPSWCAHWPTSREESGDFDWENEFTFG